MIMTPPSPPMIGATFCGGSGAFSKLKKNLKKRRRIIIGQIGKMGNRRAARQRLNALGNISGCGNGQLHDWAFDLTSFFFGQHTKSFMIFRSIQFKRRLLHCILLHLWHPYKSTSMTHCHRAIVLGSRLEEVLKSRMEKVAMRAGGTVHG